MKKQMIIAMSLCLGSQLCFSAELCGKISGETKWQGGTFSVIQADGQTIATTPYITTGDQGCTDFFPSGTYTIRFNGGLGNRVTFSQGIYGCITTPYIFTDNTLHVVFNQGFPPFNGNSFCHPNT